jgi:hypothetical protein
MAMASQVERVERLGEVFRGVFAPCALLIARRDEIDHPEPERAASFGLTLVFSALDSVMLFGELRSGAFAISDDELATELARAYLAYLGALRMRPARHAGE